MQSLLCITYLFKHCTLIQPITISAMLYCCFSPQTRWYAQVAVQSLTTLSPTCSNILPRRRKLHQAPHRIQKHSYAFLRSTLKYCNRCVGLNLAVFTYFLQFFKSRVLDLQILIIQSKKSVFYPRINFLLIKPRV